MDRTLKGFPAASPALDSADAKKVAALSARLKPTPRPTKARDEEGLLADICARPQDDGPRLVYADWLQERGDPRGEFIVLQCSRSPDPKREAGLLAKHRDAWTQPLTPVLLKGAGFARGFPSAVTAKFRHQKDAEAHGHHAAWATIDEIGWSAPGIAQDDRQGHGFVPPALNPRVLRAFEATVTQLLDRAEPWSRLEEMNVWIADVELQKRFAASSLFPRVTRLTVGHALRPELLAGSWIARIAELQLDRAFAAAVPKWLAAAGPTSLQKLTFARPGVGSLVLTRGPEGQLTRGVLSQRHATGATDYVEHLPDGWLTAFADEGTVPVGADVVQAKTRTGRKAAPAIWFGCTPWRGSGRRTAPSTIGGCSRWTAARSPTKRR